jgi:hypothetical protein
MRQLSLNFESAEEIADVRKHSKRVVELKNMILKAKNGAPRLNFHRDLGMNDDFFKFRLKKINEDLTNKNEIVRNIY